MPSYVEKFRLDHLISMLRQARGDIFAIISAIAEYELWHQDYLERNAQAASVRKQYLQGFEEDMAQLTRADFQHPTAGTHAVDGQLAVGGESELDGFDLLQPIKGDRVPNPDYPESCSIGSDGWTAAAFSGRTPRIVPFDSENDDVWEMEEPAEDVDWDELAFVFRQVGFDTRQLYGITNISDIHIDYHRRGLAVLPKGARHNSPLGRETWEDRFVAEIRESASKNNWHPWLIGTNLFE